MTCVWQLITYMDMKKREVGEDVSLTDGKLFGHEIYWQIGGDTGVLRQEQ